MRKLSVAFVTRSLADNSLGRTYSLWLLSQHLGWQAEVFSAHGTTVWATLRESDFARSLRLVAPEALTSGEQFAGFDLVIAVKPLAESLGLAMLGTGQARKPLLLDIDDPDLEGRLSFERPLRSVAREVRFFRRQRDLRKLARVAQTLPVIVSNPVLQSRYGGTVIGHARIPGEIGEPHTSTRPTVAFVGTDNPHKGLPILRAAVERIASSGAHLVVTASAPPDAKPWERWVGQTSMEEGMAIVRNSDIVAIPSLDKAFARGQLPAKAIDAMFAGRAIVASDVPPMGWALNGSGLLVEPGSVTELTDALASLADPSLRQRLGSRARMSADSLFSVEALADPFEQACTAAVAQRLKAAVEYE